MKLCLVAATTLEIEPFIKLLPSLSSQIDKGAYQFKQNKDLELTLLITGAGINQTTYYLTDLLSRHHFDLCVQVGICGSFTKDILLGEVVEITKEKFSQSGAEDDSKFLDIFEMGLEFKDQFPFKNGWIQNEIKPYPVLKSMQKVKAITVETVHGNEDSIKRTVAKYNPDVESMEGAAFFYCCSMKKIPFLQIRAVSNYVEKRNRSNWNIPLAVANLNKILIQLIAEIKA